MRAFHSFELPIELMEVYLTLSVSQSFHQNHAFQVGYFSMYSLSGRFETHVCTFYFITHSNNRFQAIVESVHLFCEIKQISLHLLKLNQRILWCPEKSSHRWNVKYICKIPRKLLTNAVAMGTRFVTSLLRRPVVCVNEQLALANSLKIISIQSEMKSILSNCANPEIIVQFWFKLQFMPNNVIYSHALN